MVTDYCIPVADRLRELTAKFELFASSELVVTDRLHGMVFCAITGTPCVVLDSKSPKVRGCYEWIRELPYIRFVEDASQVKEAYLSISQKNHCYENTHLLHYYEELAADLADIFHWR
jgi:pyruvyl transferase EpsI